MNHFQTKISGRFACWTFQHFSEAGLTGWNFYQIPQGTIQVKPQETETIGMYICIFRSNTCKSVIQSFVHHTLTFTVFERAFFDFSVHYFIHITLYLMSIFYLITLILFTIFSSRLFTMQTKREFDAFIFMFWIKCL